MIKILITLLIILNILNAGEISVFNAGNMNSSKPYGLTKTEKVIYANKEKLKLLNKKLNKINYNYDDLKQKIQGISSVYESDSENLNKTKKTIFNINNSIETVNLSMDKLKELSISNSDSIIALEKRLDKFIFLQEKNNKKIAKTLNIINNTYVNQKQFDELVLYVNGDKKLKKKINKKTKKSTIKLSNKEKLKKGIAMVKKMHLTKSIPLWNELLEDNYMPATTNFYLGEVRFGKKEYKKAIHHYKTSMLLYDEAKYIPTLLLHSAISFEKTNDKENAINFYSTLVDTYPSSKEAKKAKKQLNKLQ